MATIQDLEDIRSELRLGTINKYQALQRVGELMVQAKSRALRTKCEAFLDEIIGLPSEPKEMSAKEREALEEHFRNEG